MNGLKKSIFSLIVGCILSPISHAKVSTPMHFEGAEHIAAGNFVKLTFRGGRPATAMRLLHLPNGIRVTYGDLVALGGDFYGVPGRPISNGESSAIREAIFLAGFNTLANSQQAVVELPKIISVLHEEEKELSDSVLRGLPSNVIYQNIGTRYDQKWNCITGGSCSSPWWLRPGRYLRLAEDDFDHFGDNAVRAYLAGHHAALHAALAAHRANDAAQLERAYAMNAFASHFLTDRFSSGHMRTPRYQLPHSVTPPLVGSMLVMYMHDEEDERGLHVHNHRGDSWIAFGDRYYFSSQNMENRRYIQNAMQISADAIYTTWQTGVLPKNDPELTLIPDPDESGGIGSKDISPLFYEDSRTHQVLRRVDTQNVNDRHWTANWWGWSTLSQLALQRGFPRQQQARLIRSGYAKEAARYGLLNRDIFFEHIG